MDGTTTYEQLQAMTAQERHDHFLASIVWDMDTLTPRQRELLDQQTERVLAREEARRREPSCLVSSASCRSSSSCSMSSLPAERGPAGEPTAAEFAASDLLEIVEVFATLWDELPMPIRGRPDYRGLVLTTRLVPYVAIRGQLSPVDGAVELVDIVLDLAGPELGRVP